MMMKLVCVTHSGSAHANLKSNSALAQCFYLEFESPEAARREGVRLITSYISKQLLPWRASGFFSEENCLHTKLRTGAPARRCCGDFSALWRFQHAAKASARCGLGGFSKLATRRVAVAVWRAVTRGDIIAHHNLLPPSHPCATAAVAAVASAAASAISSSSEAAVAAVAAKLQRFREETRPPPTTPAPDGLGAEPSRCGKRLCPSRGDTP
jgi:hypothetical protein